MVGPIVVKVGGSLFDHPALGPGLRRWIDDQAAGRALCVPGGGPAADVVRQYHRVHRPPEEYSHWLAIRMMDVNGELLRHLLAGDAEVMDCSEFCRMDEGRPLALPHNWRVTSDAIAARAAEKMDALFGEIVARAGLQVRWINFRRWLDDLGTIHQVEPKRAVPL
jgi:5-(aminomethyl)-3-furanmethanol phosphate kinase